MGCSEGYGVAACEKNADGNQSLSTGSQSD